MYDKNSSESIEKYSSAVTLSDMEIFIFPELLYALVLANIMSPEIWKWRKDPWFQKIDTLSPQKRIQRLKQFIMDHFSFNLDLDTWGLTTKKVELSRFNTYVDEKILAESNALFGYEGDKYYFDIDIRRHFGLDKYTSDVIPYWKTETVEAMKAFKYKEGYTTGAGECVSLATLYAAAAFVIADIPLNDIYLYATPLHSQNFIALKDGIITNNRRIVTKTMWYNGTELSAKARRALENEKVTLVAHATGYIHTLYSFATINPDRYEDFKRGLTSFLTTSITFEIVANFLRQNKNFQSCFQIAHSCCGKPRYIEAEKVYTYEHSSKSRIGDKTQNDLLHEIEEDEFYTEPIHGRLMLSEIEAFFKGQSLPVDEKKTTVKLKEYLENNCYNVDVVIHDLFNFCRIVPQLPELEKKQHARIPLIDLTGVSTCEEAIARLQSIRNENPVVDLAFTAYRDVSRSAWKPFLKAAVERNPVSVHGANGLSVDNVYKMLLSFDDNSIYENDFRLSQPDEVWNFKRGDGLEKAICFINILQNNYPESDISLSRESEKSITLTFNNKAYVFPSSKKNSLPQKEDFFFAVG